MATRNFYLRNADRYFVAVPPSEDSEDYSHFWFTDLKDELTEIAEQVGFQHIDYTFFINEVERAANGRGTDYYGAALPCEYELSYQDRFGYYWTAYIVPLLRSGYYEGACLDFYIKVTNAYTANLENEDALNERYLQETIVEYLEDVNYRDEYKLRKDDPRKILTHVQNIIDKVKSKFYEFAEASGLDEYVLGGTFSNGEGVYLNKSELAKRALKKEAV